MSSNFEGGQVQQRSTSSVPEDPPRTYALSYIPAKGLSIILLIIAIILCLEEMEIAFATFMVLAILIEVADLIVGAKLLQSLRLRVSGYVTELRALKPNRPA